MNESEIKSKIESIKNKKIALIIAPGGVDYETNDNLAKVLVKNNNLLWLSLSYDKEVIIERLKLSPQDLKRIVFIDGIPGEVKGKLVANRPITSFAEASYAINKVLEMTPKVDLFFSESLGKLFPEYTTDDIQAFLTYLLRKLENHSVKRIMLSLKEQTYHTYIDGVKPVAENVLFLMG